MEIVIPLSLSSGALSMSPYDLNFAPPAVARTGGRREERERKEVQGGTHCHTELLCIIRDLSMPPLYPTPFACIIYATPIVMHVKNKVCVRCEVSITHNQLGRGVNWGKGEAERRHMEWPVGEEDLS